MMINHAAELAYRREILIACCAAQRAMLSLQGQALKERLVVFDIGLTVFERIKKNPAWITGVVFALVVVKPRRLWSVVQTGLLIWQALRPLAPALKNIMACRTQS